MVVKIDGDDTIMSSIVRCEWTESVDRLDAVVLTAVVHNLGASDLATKLVVGAEYEIVLEADGSPVATGKGDIVQVRHRRRGGRHRVTAVGLDAMHRLRHAYAQAQVWEVAHDAIVNDIASRNRLTGQAEGVDGTAAELLQNSGSDADFLRTLAKENNYFCRVQDDKLVFGRRAGNGSAVEIELGAGNAVDIEQTTCIDDLVTKVSVHGSDYLQDEAFTGEAAPADLKKISRGKTGVDIVKDLMGERPLILNQSGLGDASRATARAKAELQARAEKFLRGSVWVDGLPTATSGKPLKISGAGWPLDGTFFIHQTAHVLDPTGYRTRIDFLSDSLPENA